MEQKTQNHFSILHELAQKSGALHLNISTQQNLFLLQYSKASVRRQRCLATERNREGQTVRRTTDIIGKK